MISMTHSKGSKLKEKYHKRKLKGARQEDRLQNWKEHFQNLLRNPPEITEKSTENIINCQLDIKLR